MGRGNNGRGVEAATVTAASTVGSGNGRVTPKHGTRAGQCWNLLLHKHLHLHLTLLWFHTVFFLNCLFKFTLCFLLKHTHTHMNAHTHTHTLIYPPQTVAAEETNQIAGRGQNAVKLRRALNRYCLSKLLHGSATFPMTKRRDDDDNDVLRPSY